MRWLRRKLSRLPAIPLPDWFSQIARMARLILLRLRLAQTLHRYAYSDPLGKVTQDHGPIKAVHDIIPDLARSVGLLGLAV
jgi:hypothetical protein